MIQNMYPSELMTMSRSESFQSTKMEYKIQLRGIEHQLVTSMSNNNRRLLVQFCPLYLRRNYTVLCSDNSIRANEESEEAILVMKIVESV